MEGVSLHRGIDGSEPVRPEPIGRIAGAREERQSATRHLTTGTLACPECDAPVMPDGPMAPSDTLGCPFCGHGGAVRDFLSLSPPSRPARVEVRLRLPLLASRR